MILLDHAPVRSSSIGHFCFKTSSFLWIGIGFGKFNLPFIQKGFHRRGVE